MRIKLIDKKGKNFIIYGGDYKTKSNPSPHTNPVYYASLRLGVVRLIMILFHHLILSPQ